MKKQLITLITILAAFTLPSLWLSSCTDDTSNIGSSIAAGEVSITIDSIYFDLKAKPSYSDKFDSKSGDLLLGNLQTKDYGSLECSFVTRFMPAPKLEIPDSLFTPERVDSCKFTMIVNSNDLTGDSLAPQQLSVYRLTKKLPSDINNLFDPQGYYDPSSPLGSKNFIVANLSSSNNIKEESLDYVPIDVNIGKEFGRDVVEKYISQPSLFEWPQSLTDYLQGFYVKQTFGKGCVANINTAYVAIYYYSLEEKTIINDGDTTVNVVHVRDSVMPFVVSPEVLSSNKVNYKVAESIVERVENGESIVTTPCGYNISFRFPIEKLIDIYYANERNLSTVSDLTFTLQAEDINNESGISNAPNLLLIKTSEIENFFEKNLIPDSKTSFTAIYDSKTKTYPFSSLREYFVNLLDKDTIEEEDLDFTILPVDLKYETVQGYYGQTTYITKCVPYCAKPTVTKLDTQNALIVFSFSSQIIE